MFKNFYILFFLLFLEVMALGLILLFPSQLTFKPLSTNSIKSSVSHEVSNESRSLSREEYKIVQSYYLDLLNNENPLIALSDLRTAVEENESILRSCHALVHDLGHEAYEKYNGFTGAIQFQDDVCNGGYIHGVIEAHFGNNQDAVNDLTSVCDDLDPGNCYHGTGHGFMFYTVNDIKQSLELCQSHQTTIAAIHCSYGVYMEHFESDTDNSFDPSTPLQLCRLENEYKDACYYYVSSQFLLNNQNEYQAALTWCASAEKEFIQVCVRGVGGKAIKENIKNPTVVESACEQAPTRELIDACIDGMVGLYINHYNSIQIGRELCDTLKKSNQASCNVGIDRREYLFDS